MTLQIETIVTSPFDTNCYVLRSNGHCWVVDVGILPGPLAKFLHSESAEPSRLLLTHGHADHTAGVNKLRKVFPDALVTCPAGDENMLSDSKANMSGPFGIFMGKIHADEVIEPGLTLKLGTLDWHVLDTSGHTPGGVSYYCPSQEVVISGDALFAGTVGRTDLPGASAGRLLRNIRRELMTLPEVTRVLPGHGPETTIGQEKRSNPFFKND